MSIPSSSARTSAVAFAVALLAAPGAAQTVKDTLVKRSGERLRGVEILELGVDTIKYKRAGSESEMPALQLSYVEWTEPPDAFDLGRGALDKGDSEAAANFFQEAATKAAEAGRKALEAECKFFAARALAVGMGTDATRAAAARDALQAFLGATPGHFRSPEARLLLARAMRVAGDAAGAEAALKSFEEDALQGGWGLQWDARAKLERAQLLLAENKAAEARSAFQGVRAAVDAALGSIEGNEAQELTALKMLAVVSEGETFLREGKLDEARKYFSQLASSARDDVVRAAALAGEAQALVLAHAGKTDTRPLREAQIKLAEAILLDTAGADTSAKALYLQGKILSMLSPQQETDNKQRARDYFESVVKHYSGSPWAIEARAELKQ